MSVRSAATAVALVLATSIVLTATASSASPLVDAATAPSADGGVAAIAVVPAPAAQPALVDPVAAQRDWEAGLAKLRADELGDALALLKTANAADPGNAFIANDLGYALMKLGARREAEAFFRRVLQIDPRRAVAYTNLADLVADSPERWQRQDEILGLLRKGAGLLRDDTRGRTLLGLSAAAFEQRVGRLSDARHRLEEIVAQKPAGGLRKRALDLLAAVADQERAAVLADWPEPPPMPETTAALRAIDAALADGHADQALAQATTLAQSTPSSTAARFARARAQAALGRYDQATRELTVLLQLRPSHAEAWRLLGTILALHGGVLESDHADQALRRALALEPSWDDLRALRRQVAERRQGDGISATASPPNRSPPSAKAQALFDDAQRLLGGDTPEAARAPLGEALADSPAYIEAAISFFALTGEVPPATVQALSSDGEALVHLATEALHARPDAATTELARPWLDRAVALGNGEALFQRALLRADEADATGALADLAAYVGADVSPPHLAEARALRRNLEPPRADAPSTVALARELLLADRPREAARALGGPCRAGLAPDVLVQLGRIAEYEGRGAEAIACHRLALAGDPSAAHAGRDALERLTRIAARMPPPEARALETEIQRAVALKIPTAFWATARLAAADQRWEQAVEGGENFLKVAAADDPLRAEVASTVDDWRRGAGETRAQRSALVRRSIETGAALLALLLIFFVVRRWRGRTVAATLLRVPDLFPDVAAVVGEIRHDILKHRISALSLLGESVTAREEIQRALTEPTPTSVAVTVLYDRLRRAAAAAGVSLRPLEREPVFGPLVRALASAETLIGRPGSGKEIAAVDRDLRDRHGPALAALLALAPTTPVTADSLAAIAASAVPDDSPPGVEVPAGAVSLPLPPQAVHAILGNLLRNALGAAGSKATAQPVVRVMVSPGRDVAGRRLVMLLVADAAPAMITLADIDRRDGQRGLGVVRELVRRWGGHMVVQAEAPPLVKAIGAAFPAPSRGDGP
ncbi:MAG TPA: tetratricopeptide repeat protein [Polyangia bacterium]